MGTNRFRGGSPAQRVGVGNPATNAVPVVPADGGDIACGCSTALVIGVAGNLRVTTLDGDDVTLLSVPAGILPLMVTRVWATNTTATGISALYSN
jgi:hypothetical protein